MKNNVVLQNDDTNKIMIGREWHNGDWNLRLATRITYMEEYLSENELKTIGKYHIEILAVSPESAGEKNLKSAYDCIGLDDDQIDKIPLCDYEALISYGVYATLFSKSGNNLKSLIHDANYELQLIHGLFGFYMDRAENRIGNNGWDFISGNIGWK